MKTLHAIIFILIFIGQSLFAQYNLSPDAPLNPVPIKFHKDHFFLKGNIKSLKEYDTNGEIETEYFFDEQGYLKSRYEYFKSSIDEETTADRFIYGFDEDNKLKSINCTDHFHDIRVISYVNNNPGEIIDIDKNIRKFEYDKNGNLIKEYTENKTDMNYYFDYEYQYDNKNRLIKKKVFKPDGSLNKTVTYSYQQEGDILKITENNGKEVFTRYYKNGQPNNIKIDDKGNPVSDRLKYVYYITYQTKETAKNKGTCISGNCQNGWGTKKYENGKYTGFFEQGTENGFGKYYWETGELYSGQWKNGKITGLGKYYNKNDDFEMLEGEFLNGKLNGLGVVKMKNRQSQGSFSEGKLISYYSYKPTGNETGCMEGNCRNGYGRYKRFSPGNRKHGDMYEGFWKNGNIYMGNYDRYEDATFLFGYFNQYYQLNGFGTMSGQGGSYYAGEWKNGKFHGKGYYKNDKGEEQIGIWENGKLVKSLK